MTSETMTIAKDPAAQAIDDARALLEALLTSGAQQIHLDSGGTEIYIARMGAAPSPMRARAAAALTAPAASLGAEVAIKAPHVATLVQVLGVGTQVTAGQAVATVHVLDEPEDIVSPVAGVITGIGAAAGDLLDYGTVVLTVREAA
ncbi:biotin/lipoyl-containing protein [Novosphingobium colocasiae]|uniref:biotin/lipoyl-containing protein n=1 Tax=Novosphingobium colocasiae TaxID=1256513 RepID=UPI0035B13C7C